MKLLRLTHLKKLRSHGALVALLSISSLFFNFVYGFNSYAINVNDWYQMDPNPIPSITNVAGSFASPVYSAVNDVDINDGSIQYINATYDGTLSLQLTAGTGYNKGYHYIGQVSRDIIVSFGNLTAWDSIESISLESYETSGHNVGYGGLRVVSINRASGQIYLRLYGIFDGGTVALTPFWDFLLKFKVHVRENSSSAVAGQISSGRPSITAQLDPNGSASATVYWSNGDYTNELDALIAAQNSTNTALSSLSTTIITMSNTLLREEAKLNDIYTVNTNIYNELLSIVDAFDQTDSITVNSVVNDAHSTLDTNTAMEDMLFSNADQSIMSVDRDISILSVYTNATNFWMQCINDLRTSAPEFWGTIIFALIIALLFFILRLAL